MRGRGNTSGQKVPRLIHSHEFVTHSRLAKLMGVCYQKVELSESEVSTLLDRIMAFELDDPLSGFPFTSRLASEQGWSHAFAGSVVTEYKRFLFLAMVSGHPVSPSEAVDHAWHLHLLYTRSYWHDLCRDILGYDFHHQPSTGGPNESRKFADWYSGTLESYRRHFHREPPADVWPTRSGSSRKSTQKRWIDPAAFWLIPRCPWLDMDAVKKFLSKKLLRK